MGKAVNVTVPEAYEKQLSENLTLGWTVAHIRQAGKEQLLSMQYRLGLGDQWGRMEIPKAFLPAGGAQFDSCRIFEIAQFLPLGMAIEGGDANRAWTEILRFVASRLTLPGPRRAKIAGYSTCKIDIAHMKVFARAILQLPVEEGFFWSRIEGQPFARSRSSQAAISAIRHYHQLGALPDALRTTGTIVSDEPERDRSNEPEYETPVNENRKWQPLPMEFVAQVGWRSLLTIKSIAPTLLKALEAALEIPDFTVGIHGRPVTPYQRKLLTNRARDAVLANWQWEDQRGEPLHDRGFVALQFNGKPMGWPPRTFNQAMRAAHQLVKPAHLWMVLLGNGARNGEVVSMRENCLAPAPNGNFRWKGRTFKMTGITGGRETDAIVPEIITQSIIQQAQLARLTRKHRGTEGNSLWVGYCGEEIKSLSEVLNKYIDVLGLRALLGNDNPSCHEHRFRKTLAKIVALALTNAIMILKDCFGHTDAVMTLLSYITADPTIAQEVIKLQKELTIMMAVDVIMDRGTVGGPGAASLRQRADEYLKRIGKSEFEPQDAYEFARRETFDGRSWMMVAPGVFCTSPHGITQVSTPCAVGQRRHNTANCKTGCDWQLLLQGYYVTQADDTVNYTLKNLQRAVDDDEESMVAFWAGQAKAWIYRYDEVAEKWKDHHLVKQYAHRPMQIIMTST